MQSLLNRYRFKGILLDSNLLLLLLIGLADPKAIADSKRTNNQGFTDQEFFLLIEIVKRFSKVVSTPHILTETSNFIFQLKGKTLQSVVEITAKNVQTFKERRAEAKTLVKSEAFVNFGLTDSAILDLPPKKYLVFSVDAALVIALQKKGIDAINFNHLRQLSWQR